MENRTLPDMESSHRHHHQVLRVDRCACARGQVRGAQELDWYGHKLLRQGEGEALMWIWIVTGSDDFQLRIINYNTSEV